MGRCRNGVLLAALTACTSFCWGCGGGGSASAVTQPPPPAPDFTLTPSSNSVSVSQGGTSSPIQFTVAPLNGFTGTVQVSLGTLPTGISSNPASPFPIASGASVSVLFGAAANAGAGSFTITAQGTSGALSHGANLQLTVQSANQAALPRTTYVRTDSTAAADNPPGEPHHRHIAYDPGNKHVFIANRTMNRVEVFSSANQTRVAQIMIPGAGSADISADGTTIWIGTYLNQIVSIGTSSLRISARYPLAGLAPIPGTIFDCPIEVLSLSSGKAMVRLRQTASSEALLALWDSVANALTDLTSTAPSLFQQGVGVLARSGDHTKIFAAANDATGEVAIYGSGGNVLAGPLSIGSGSISANAANLDGSRVAAVLISNGIPQLLLFDGALNLVGSYTPSTVNGVSFSRDGSLLYVAESGSGAAFITVLNGQTAQLIGRIADAALQGVSSQIEDVDETQLLFGLNNRGVSFLDAATPGNLPSPAPVLSAVPSVQPSQGPFTGGTSLVVSGQNFASLAQLKLGSQPAANPVVAGTTQIQASSPASTANGAANVTAFFQNTWLALAPDAFSYGPQILQILPNAGMSAGGDTVQIYGYGFGSDPTSIAVQIGGTVATVQSVQSVSNIVSSLGIDSSYPFPIECITLQTPAGSAGEADVAVTSPAGSATSSKAFQFLQSVQSFPKSALYKFLLYDQQRQHVYLSATDHVDVFDLQQSAFVAPLALPGGPTIFTDLRGMALIPGASQLVVADFGDQSVYLINPDTGSGSAIAVGGVSGFANSGPARVAATSTQAVFVGLSGEGGSSGACTACLAQMNLMANPPTIQPAPEPEVSSLTGAPLVQSDAAGDRVFVAFGSSPGGPLAVWDAASPNQFATASANTSTTDIGAAADGTIFSVLTNGMTQVRNSDLSLGAVPVSQELLQIPGRVQVPGLTLHPSGALLYQPFLTGSPGSAGIKGGIDILDAHSGTLRLRIFLPQQLMTDTDGLHGGFLTTDENGQRLFALTSSDGTPQNATLTIVQLAHVPLGIGTVSPSSVSAAGGATLSIRGSGFQSGIVAAINGTTASVTFIDSNTLSIVVPALASGAQQLTLTNPDGESVSLDAAFTAN